MKRGFLIGLVMAAAVLGGCVVQCIQPLFAEREYITYPGLAGTWVQKEDDGKASRFDALVAGEYEIEAQAPDHETAKQAVTLGEAETKEVRIELPEVQPGVEEAGAARAVLPIDVDPEGAVRLRGGAPITTRAELDLALAGELVGRLPEEVVVELRADRETPHGLAVELLQHLRLRGFTQVQLLATGYSATPEELGGWRR